MFPRKHALGSEIYRIGTNFVLKGTVLNFFSCPGPQNLQDRLCVHAALTKYVDFNGLNLLFEVNSIAF